MKRINIILAIFLIAIVAGGILIMSYKGRPTAPQTTNIPTSAVHYPNVTTPAQTTNNSAAIATTTNNSIITTATPNNTTVIATNAKLTVKISNNTTLGPYLINGSGYTLYTYSGDSPNSGTSSCTGGCISIWPPFYTPTLVLQKGLNASEFGTITRAGGIKQLTYKGWPLYLYTGDSKPGQTNGEGVAGFYVAKV